MFPQSQQQLQQPHSQLHMSHSHPQQQTMAQYVVPAAADFQQPMEFSMASSNNNNNCLSPYSIGSQQPQSHQQLSPSVSVHSPGDNSFWHNLKIICILPFLLYPFN
jgi:hypothetical protein